MAGVCEFGPIVMKYFGNDDFEALPYQTLALAADEIRLTTPDIEYVRTPITQCEMASHRVAMAIGDLVRVCFYNMYEERIAKMMGPDRYYPDAVEPLNLLLKMNDQWQLKTENLPDMAKDLDNFIESFVEDVSGEVNDALREYLDCPDEFDATTASSDEDSGNDNNDSQIAGSPPAFNPNTPDHYSAPPSPAKRKRDANDEDGEHEPVEDITEFLEPFDPLMAKLAGVPDVINTQTFPTLRVFDKHSYELTHETTPSVNSIFIIGANITTANIVENSLDHMPNWERYEAYFNRKHHNLDDDEVFGHEYDEDCPYPCCNPESDGAESADDEEDE